MGTASGAGESSSVPSRGVACLGRTDSSVPYNPTGHPTPRGGLPFPFQEARPGQCTYSVPVNASIDPCSGHIS